MIDAKYRAGQEAHGGNLFDLTEVQLIDEALMEAVDQMTYLITLRSKYYANRSTMEEPGPLARQSGEAQVRTVRDLPTNENLY